MEDLISVIVPVYNVEKYLNRCIDSIINQTYKNLEIILVDDGSPDNCGKICDEYAKKDSRIKVIHKENGGLSDARNAGINISIGKYITFVDSDDYLELNFIETLYNLNKKNNTFIAVAPYIINTDKNEIFDRSISNDMILTQREALENMLLDRGFTVSAHSKLYEKALFNNIFFPKGKIFEDSATTYKLILKCDKISYCYNGGYHYYKRSESIINSKYNKNQLLFIYYSDKMGEEILKKYPDLYYAVENKKIDSRFSILRRMILTDNLSIEDQDNMNKIIKYILNRKKKIIFGKFSKKIKIATLLLSINLIFFKFGWKYYCKIKYKTEEK